VGKGGEWDRSSVYEGKQTRSFLPRKEEPHGGGFLKPKKGSGGTGKGGEFEVLPQM